MPMTTVRAPIVLFVYNRLESTRRTVEALLANEGAEASDVFIYSDGARGPTDAAAVAAVRDYLRTIGGFGSVTIVERDRNFGLANNIVDGVTAVVNERGRVIVLEDDLVTAPNFLRYMNDALEKYRSNAAVYSVTGYSFTDDVSDIDSTYFLSMTSSWGWATWADRWRHFRRDAGELRARLENPAYRWLFDFSGSYRFSDFVSRGEKGEVDSWAVYWHASVLDRHGLTLYPAKRLVRNIGHDGTGMNCGVRDAEKDLVHHPYVLTDHVTERRANRKVVERILLERNGRSLKSVLLRMKSEWDARLSPECRARLSQGRNFAKILLMGRDIGPHTHIGPGVHVTGWRSVRIGHHTTIGEGTWLNVNDRVASQKQIVIGSNCYLGFRNFLTSGRLIEIGDYVMTGIDCRFLGSDHVIRDPWSPYSATGTTHDKVIRIGVNTWIGAGVSVLGGVSIGHGSVIGAGSFVTKTIPPFSTAFGNPCRVVRRFDFSTSEWIPVEQITADHERRMPSEDEYRDILKKDYPALSIPLQAASHQFGDLF